MFAMYAKIRPNSGCEEISREQRGFRKKDKRWYCSRLRTDNLMRQCCAGDHGCLRHHVRVPPTFLRKRASPLHDRSRRTPTHIVYAAAQLSSHGIVDTSSDHTNRNTDVHAEMRLSTTLLSRHYCSKWRSAMSHCVRQYHSPALSGEEFAEWQHISDFESGPEHQLRIY